MIVHNFLIVRVFDNPSRRIKTIFCINCKEEDFYFKYLHKKTPINEEQEEDDTGNLF